MQLFHPAKESSAVHIHRVGTSKRTRDERFWLERLSQYPNQDDSQRLIEHRH